MPPPLDSGWTFDQFDDGSARRLAIERESKRLETFVRDFSNRLTGVQDQLESGIDKSYDSSLRPIQLDTKPFEDVPIYEIISTDNKVLNKIIMALSSLCCEVKILQEEANEIFYPPIVMYAEGILEEEFTEGNVQEMIGEMLPFFQNLSNFVVRIYDVVKNIVHQLSSLYTSGKTPQFDPTGIHFQYVFEHLGDALAILIALDDLIASNEHLMDHWAQYKRLIVLVRNDPTRFGTTENQLKLLEKMLFRIEGTILDGNIFKNVYEQQYDYPGLVNVTKNVTVSTEFDINIREYFDYLQARIGESNETDQRFKFVGFCALYVFHYRLFHPQVDKKFLKNVWLIHKKLPVVSLFPNFPWIPAQFLMAQMPQHIKALGKNDAPVSQQAAMKKLDDSMPSAAQEWFNLVCIWMVRLESELPPSIQVREVIANRIPVLLQGLLYARTISNLIQDTINLHSVLGVPLNKKLAGSLCQLVETLKSIEQAYNEKEALIADNMPFVMQQLTYSLVRILIPVKERLTSAKKFNDKILDGIAALSLMISSLEGPPTVERLTITHLAFSIVIQLKMLKEEEVHEIKNLFRKIENLAFLKERLRHTSSCKFLFWNRVLIPTYFSEVFQNPTRARGLQYIMMAISDCRPMIEKSLHQPQVVLEEFEKEIYTDLKEGIVNPLARHIETDLRLHIHSHLKLDDRNPFNVGLVDHAPLLDILPLHFSNRTVDIKEYVRNYLDTTFYNLTTVALHDWRTYAEMRNLAKERYGIDMVEVHLPAGTLEQGIDALEIMRNIHVFVSRYNYSISNQIFVEKESNNKHLNTINVRHVANSIRTHGTGVMNTTVNVTYQFLIKKFSIFTQFLYDDYIKSKLIKDVRFYRDSKDELNSKYPFERAEKFTKAIRKLGTTGSDQLTYLDQFRILVTTIGNAMGYIRMVRSGGLHHCSNAVNFLPELENILSFEELVKEESLSAESTTAARLLDSAIENLTKNFTESTDYFKLLVEVFAKQLRDTKNSHLKNFHIIIPPLTLNFVEHMLNSKEKLDKKKKDGAAFSDDGFAMGVAYILKLLDQNAAFDSLHWFDSVGEYYATEIIKLRNMQQGKKKSDEQQSVVLTQQKLARYRREFQLLGYSLTGARIFFREEGENFAEATKPKEGENISDTGSIMEKDPPAA